MRQISLQTRIAGSRKALPIIIVYAAGVAIAAGLLRNRWWPAAAVFAASIFLMFELNNIHALIRVYSRMISCSFIVLMTTGTFLLPSFRSSIVQLCFIVFVLFFFSAYQNRRAMGRLFYAFAFLGIASLFFVQILYLVPVLIVLLASNLMAWSWRNLLASLSGIIAVYWFALAYVFFSGSVDRFAAHFASCGHLPKITMDQFTLPHIIIVSAFILLIFLIGTVYFARNSFRDKIKTRMIFFSCITMGICFILFLGIQPQHYDMLLKLFIVCAAPLCGHFIALTNTRLTNVLFILLCVAAIAITVYNVTFMTPYNYHLL